MVGRGRGLAPGGLCLPPPPPSGVDVADQPGQGGAAVPGQDTASLGTARLTPSAGRRTHVLHLGLATGSAPGVSPVFTLVNGATSVGGCSGFPETASSSKQRSLSQGAVGHALCVLPGWAGPRPAAASVHGALPPGRGSCLGAAGAAL